MDGKSNMALYHPLNILDREIRLLYISDADSCPADRIDCSMVTVALTAWSDSYLAFRKRADEFFSISSTDTPSIPHPREYEVWVSFQKQQLGDAFKDTNPDAEDEYHTNSNPQLARFIWGDYETLSYTWGTDSQPKHTISLNGLDVTIGENLYNALRTFKDEGRYRIGSGFGLWVDALCLNQADTAEKSVQVQRMCDIYAWSSRAVIWLGAGLPWFDDNQQTPEAMTATNYARHLADILHRNIEDAAAKGPSPSEDIANPSSDISSEPTGKPADFLANCMPPPAGPGNTPQGPNRGPEVTAGTSQEPTTDSGTEINTTDGSPPEEEESEPESIDDDDEEESPEDDFVEYQQTAEPLQDLNRVLPSLRTMDLQTLPTRNPRDILFIKLFVFVRPLLTHNYWRRVWIMQELIFSSSSSILCFGVARIRLHTLLEICRLVWIVADYDGLDLAIDQPLMFLILAQQIQDQGRLWNSCWVTTTRPRLLPSTSQGLTLLAFLAQSTLPVDRLYAAMGLLNPAVVSHVVVDYKNSTQRVARDAALAMIMDFRHLIQLAWPRQFHDPDLPSWAPDLAQGFQNSTLSPPGDFFRVDAGRSRKLWDEELFRRQQVEYQHDSRGDWRTLVLNATHLDVVDGVTAFPEYDGCEAVNSVRMAPTHADFSLVNTRGQTHSYPSDQAMVLALSRLLRMRLHGAGSIRRVLAKLIPLALDPEVKLDMTESEVTMLRRTALFFTANANFRLWDGIQEMESLIRVPDREADETTAGQEGKNEYMTGTIQDKQAVKQVLKQCKTFGGFCRLFRLVTTKNGWLGLADRFVKTGDRLSLINGTPSELAILRPSPDGYYEFIGMAKVPHLRRKMDELQDKGGFAEKILLR